MRLRLAVAGDAPVLSSLSQRSFRETFHHYDEAALTRFLQARDSEAFFAAAIADPHTTLWLAEIDGKPIAYAKLGDIGLPVTPAITPAVELHRLYVLRDFQGRGMGDALMQLCFEEAHAQEARAMVLGVWEHNLAAQKFYGKYGFVRVGEYAYPPIGEVHDREWVMQKVL